MFQAVRRVGVVLGAALVLLGLLGAGFESSHGLGALWEHWWCATPLVVIALGIASVVTAHRMGSPAR
jgi:hypothetical protein